MCGGRDSFYGTWKNGFNAEAMQKSGPRFSLMLSGTCCFCGLATELWWKRIFILWIQT